jgi:hypothetical protein
MGCVPSSEFAVGQEVAVRDGWGDLLYRGTIEAAPSPYSLVVAGRLCSTSSIEVGTMSAERPYEHFNREELEGALAQMAAQVAGLQAEAQGMAEVLAMQMDAISAPTVAPVTKGTPSNDIVRDAAEANKEWFEGLVDLLELYLVRQLGQRHPVAIADPDLRALVSHILD